MPRFSAITGGGLVHNRPIAREGEAEDRGEFDAVRDLQVSAIPGGVASNDRGNHRLGARKE